MKHLKTGHKGKPGKGRQVAALPFRWNEDGKLQVLMVTSRDTGRWVLPKGWRMTGRQPWDAAMIEAHEEAGARGRISEETLGEYSYDKRYENGDAVPTQVDIYPLAVSELADTWKEDHQRKRKWFTLKQAAKLVDEDDLSELLIDLKISGKMRRFRKSGKRAVR